MNYLIASWGDPSGWEKVTYKLNDEPSESKTTLLPLYKHYKPDKLIIIVNDTLPKPPLNNPSYNEFSKNVEDNYKDKLNELVRLNEQETKLSILVIPTNGSFKIKDRELLIHLNGNINDMVGYLYYKLTNEFVNDIEHYYEDNEELNVILDITHGHNLLPLTTYRHIKTILSILAFKYKTKLTVHISDPIARSDKEREAILNKIEDDELTPNIYIEKLGKEGNCILIKPITDNTNVDNNFYEVREDKTYKDKNCFINSFYKGIPLGLCSFYPDLKVMKCKIESIISKWLEYINIHIKDSKIDIYRRLYLTKDFNNYVLIYFFAYILNKLGIEHKKEITFEEFKDINNKVYGKLPIQALIDRAIYEINEIKGNIPNDWTDFKDIIIKSKVGDFDEQNFLAHAGLEYNVTQLKRFDSQIYFRYKEDMLDRIKKVLS